MVDSSYPAFIIDMQHTLTFFPSLNMKQSSPLSDEILYSSIGNAQLHLGAVERKVYARGESYEVK